MANSFVNSNTATATSATSVAVPMPASLAENDIVVVIAAHTATSNVAINGPGDWTELAEEYSNDTRDTNSAVFYKRMGSTPDTTMTVSDGASVARNWVAISYAVRGVDLTTAIDVTTTSVGAAVTNTGNVNSPAIIPVTDGAWVLTCGASSCTIAGLTITEPSGYSSNPVSLSHGTANISVVMAWKEISPAASENPANWVFSTSGMSDSYSAFSVALRPATAKTVTADAGSYALTGTNAATEFGREVAADAGSYALTGTDVTFSRGKSVVADSGSYTLNGVDAATEVGRRVTAEAGSYALTGVDVSLERGLEIVTDAGSYVLNGVDAALERGLEVTADVGSYLLTGTDADLILTTVGGKTLVADPGSYVLTGQDAALEWGREITAEAGSYELTGQSVNLVLPAAIVAAESQAALICAVGRLLSRR